MRGTIPLLTLTLMHIAPAVGQECSGGAKLESTECGAVSFEGCCDEEQLLFCEGGMLCARDCAGFPHCGWNGVLGYYDCGTAGQDDPAGLHDPGCPTGGPDVCGGLDGRGCCDGAVVRWCDGSALHEIDCALNGTRTVCGLREGAADCAEPGASAGPACGGGGLTDVVTGPDGGIINLDAVTVPDLSGAPSTCSTIQGIYDVAASDCGVFAERFGIKQRGCVAVLVDLVGGDRPAARVTKSGLSFDFLDAGLTRSCLGQIDGESISGECLWTGGACAFTFQVAPEPAPGPTPDQGGGGGGCSQTAGDPAPVMFLLFVLLFSLPIFRRTSTMKPNQV
ncbi:MAG: hypothetical protein ABIK09_17720 [Pseudomonadota bacterium]